MRTMFRQMFTAITVFFRTVERGANALDSYAQWAEEEARDFQQTAAAERAKRLAALADV